MELTRDNYFSTEMSRKYCGSSQFKNFMKCPAMAMAVIEGRWQEPKTLPLLIGGYVDAYFEGTLARFLQENPEVYSRNGKLKAPFVHADYIINRITSDDLFMRYMSGEKQVIRTGIIAGVPFKIRIDSYHAKKALVDLKVIKNFDPILNEEKGVKEDFIHHWGYDIQAAIYQAVEGDSLPFYIAAATKEDEPDFAVIHMPQTWIDSAYHFIENEVGLIQATKDGDIPAHRCEKCAYCRATKKLSRVISAEDLIVEREGE